MWHHEHRIESVPGGVIMTDVVTNEPPFRIFGAIANSLIIKNRLKKIFDYRSVALKNKFPEKKSI